MKSVRLLVVIISLIAAAAMVVACGLSAVGQAPSGDGLPDRDGAVLPDDGGDGGSVAPPSGPPLPSFLPPSTLDAEAGALANVVQIDTSDPPSLDVGSGLSASLPPGVTFTVMNAVADAGTDGSVEVAVLSTGAFHVDQNVKVRGTRPLVVVAAGAVAIDAIISANAETFNPGPGGFDPGKGPGKGGDANTADVTDDSGGGGAGHLHMGAQGADFNSAIGGAAGASYDLPLRGGSGGGSGAGSLGCANGGGAGGGAIQIFSAEKIVVSAGGAINAGGGGGRGGCADGSSGGGGGSGGFVLLEAPAIEIAGTLAANGGGGGGGGEGATADGSPGSDGVLGAIAAPGGAGSKVDQNGGAGGTSTPPTKPGPATSNGGGGGGSAGRIQIRTRKNAASVASGIISPGATFRTDL